MRKAQFRLLFNRQWSEDQCDKNRTSVNKGKAVAIEKLNGEELKNVDHFKYLGSVHVI